MTPVNDPPVDGNELNDNNEAVVTPEDTPLVKNAAAGVLANATDVDGVPTVRSQIEAARQGGGYVYYRTARNGTLGGAYFIVAARALGLDCGPMSGVDLNKVNAEFFPDGRWKANFLINLGQGDDSKLFDRNPRLSFEQACQVL